MRNSTHSSSRMILAALLVALAFVSCGPGDDAPAGQTYLRNQAKAIMDALVFEGAELHRGSPDISSEGYEARPWLESVESSYTQIEGRDFTIRMVVALDHGSAVEGVALMVDYADSHLRVPVQVSAQNETVTISGRLAHGSGASGSLTSARIGLYGSQGVLGNYLIIPIHIQEQPGEFDFSLRSLASHTNRVTALAFPRQGSSEHLLTGSDDRTLAVWDLNSERCSRRLHGHSGRVLSVFPNSDLSLIASASQDASVRVWDGQTGAETFKHEDHLDFVPAVAMSFDEQILASGSWDGTVRLLGLSDQLPRQTMTLGDRVNALEFSADEQLLAVGTGTLVNPGAVHVFACDDWSERFVFSELPGRVTAVAFSPDGSTLAAAMDRGLIVVWSMLDGQELVRFLEGSDDTVTGLAFSPAQPDRLACVSINGLLSGWILPTGQSFLQLQSDRSFTGLSFSADGQWLAAGRFPEGVTWLVKASDLGF